MTPSVQVLLATYHSESFLEEQIQSIMAQEVVQSQLLIRDDGSQDGTWEMILALQRQYSGRIHAIRGDRLGPKENFHALLQMADAPYVALSDADDRWLPYKLAQGLRTLHHAESLYGSSTPLLVCSDSMLCNAQGALLHRSFWEHQHLSPKRTALRHLLVQNMVQGATLLCNRALLDRALPIPEEAIMHDWWLGLMAAATGQILPLSEPLLLYRQHSQNVLGAAAHPLVRLWKRGLPELCQMRRHLLKTLRQAKALAQHLEQIGGVPTAAALAREYSQLERSTLWKCWSTLMQGGLWRNTLLQKLGQCMLLPTLSRSSETY